MRLVGIDIGGTKTGVCVGEETGRILASQRIPMAANEPVESYRRRLEALCRDVLRSAGVAAETVDGVGISAPGAMDVQRGIMISPPNNPGWRDVPIVELVGCIFPAPAFLNNDANACALAEQHFGSHRGVRNLIYLTFSTGMGAGIVLNGQLIQGQTSTAGEVGHHVLDPNGPLCGCGQKGCWEAFVGGRMVAERLKATIRAGNLKTSIVEKAGGDVERISMQALEAAAREGDALAVEEWNHFTDRVAQGIGNLIMILNPEVIVLGTMAIHGGEFVMRPIREKVRKYAWKWPLEACQIVPSTLGGKIGDLGAIAVAMDGLRSAARSP